MIITRFLIGLNSVIASFKFLFKKPRIFLIIVIPVIITAFLFSLAIYLSLDWFIIFFSDLLNRSELNQGIWKYLFYLLILLFALLLLFTSSYFILSLSKVFAAPFLDYISALADKEFSDETGLKAFLSHSWQSIIQETKKISVIFLVYFCLWLSSFIPLMQILIIPLGLFISVLIIALDFSDYALSRRHFSLKEKIKFVIRHTFEFSGFALVFYVLFLIPFINFFAIFLACISATLLINEIEASQNKSEFK